MGYTAGPAGSDTIAASDNLIKDNFAHIVSAFSTDHVWDATTAASCIHKTTVLKKNVGTFTRALNAAAGDVAITGVGFIPQLVLFFVIGPLGTNANWMYSLGGYDSTNHACVHNAEVLDQSFSATSSTYCIYLSDATVATQYQRAVVKSLDADGFTLTWSTLGMTSTNTAKIFFLCLRFS